MCSTCYEEVEEANDLVSFVMGWFADLTIRKNGVEDAEVCVFESISGWGIRW